MGITCDHVSVPRQRRRARPTGPCASGVYMFRGERPIPYESTLERDFIIRHEFDPNVLEIVPQPFEIPFQTPDGRTDSYTPDFFVLYRLGDRHWAYAIPPLLVEVKPRDEILRHWRKWSPKFKAAIKFSKEKHVCLIL